MKNILHLCLFFLMLLSYSCSNEKEKSSILVCSNINFGKLAKVGNSEIISDYAFIPLESSESALFGEINQIELFNGHYYILDREKTLSIYQFSSTGSFVRKIASTGNGPGEFIAPHTFKIDSHGGIYVLDRSLNKILKYNAEDFSYLEEIVLPNASPLSFSILEDSDSFIYYYPLRENNQWNDMQLLVSDKKGNVTNRLYPGTPKGKILHGNPNNFYFHNNRIRFTPHFSNTVYELQGDSLLKCYELSWQGHSMPEESLFTKYDNSGDIMKEVLSNEWIRLIYLYETDDALMVKYYIKRELYLSYLNKESGKVCNTKIDAITDNIGLGNSFPAPIGVSGDKFMGALYPYNMELDAVSDPKLRNAMKSVKIEDNPILVVYK